MSQPTIPGVAPEPELKLTSRQRYALDVIASHGPIQSVELGAYLCERRGKHSHDVVCEWCQSSGKEVGRALAKRGLVKRRRGEGWVPADWQPDYGSSAIQGDGEIPF